VAVAGMTEVKSYAPASGNNARSAPTTQVFITTDSVDETRRKRDDVWLKMAKLAEPQWRLEAEKFEMELALHNNPIQPNAKQIRARIAHVEQRLRPLRKSTERYQKEVDEYDSIIRASRW
jgi:hypothetical protein